MKKLLAIVISLIMAATCFPLTALAESENLGEVEIMIEYGAVTYFDDEATTIYETLMAMGDEGIINVSGQSFDLDQNGTIDLLTSNYSYDGGCSTEFSKAETKSITGQITLVASEAIKNSRIAAGKNYLERITVVFEDLCPKGGKHNWVMGTDKASFGKNGCTYAVCSKCNEKQMGFPLLKVDASMEAASYTYNGKAKTPKVNVSTYDGPLDTKFYKTEYINNVNAGTASVKITLIGDYFAGTKTFNFKINKAENPLSAKAKKPVVKLARLKKKNQVIKLKKAIAISKAKGKVSCKKIKGSKKITVAKNGKITVKKGLKKGTYKVKIKVSAAGSVNYKAASKTVTVKITVK